jgi:hypothetical protein
MSAAAESFIVRWSHAEASERANAQQFLVELAEHEQHPETGIPWEEFDARLKQRLGE